MKPDKEQIPDECREETGKGSCCSPRETIRVINAGLDLSDEPVRLYYSSPCLLSEIEEDGDILKK